LRPFFVRVVKRAFSQRRKMMKNLLRAEWLTESVERAMKEVGLHPQLRAEAVSLTQFVALTEQLAALAGSAGVFTGTTMKNPRSPAGTPAHPVHPSEEIFDVVNAQDEVIGAASRAEVHARGLVHRAVHVLVFNQRGEVFIQKRSMTKDKSPGLWDSSASGHLERGEDYDTCALRELREEIGLTPPLPPQRLFKLGACQETDQEHVWVYRCQSEGPFTLNPAEIERGEWVAPAVLTLRIAERPGDFASAFRFLWSRLPDAGPR
jgi:isopentenyldiphosphate isomerase